MNHIFTGRSKEIASLDRCMEAETAQLIMVCGRRRVGKTFLSNEYFKNQFAFKITGAYKKPKQFQLDSFAEELGRKWKKDCPSPSNWREAFRQLRDYLESLPSEEKQVIFFDEIPWLDTPMSDFLPLFHKGYSPSQNIDRILFKQNAPLRHEFAYLYVSIFRKPEGYLKIVKALSRKQAGLTREELIAASGIPNSGDLTKKLEELESCGFIRKYTAFGMKKKKAVYQLIDFFTIFYYHFLDSEPSDEHFWSNQINTPAINTWKGLAFERVCLEHVSQIKKRLGISGVYTQEHSWQCPADPDRGIFGSQIDLLIVRKDQVINLCEMKYSASEYVVTEKTDQSIRKKIHDLKTVTGTKYAIYPTLVTTLGVVENAWSGNLQAVIVEDDLFQLADE